MLFVAWSNFCTVLGLCCFIFADGRFNESAWSAVASGLWGHALAVAAVGAVLAWTDRGK